MEISDERFKFRGILEGIQKSFSLISNFSKETDKFLMKTYEIP
jgi:hypothetical protein